jgi:hypothetical protein
MELGLHAWLRLIAGTFTLVSTVLGLTVSPWFFAFTAFVGLNQMQSAFTGWCPMITLLRRVGVEHEAPSPT